MGAKEDIRKLKNKPRFLNGYAYVYDVNLSAVTCNILMELFKPYAYYPNEKLYRLDDEQIKIVTDILELMED